MSIPYNQFNPVEFILRDWLALDRTILANERTFLAYSRTALTLILAGLTLIRFFGSTYWAISGYCFLAIGIVLWLLGLKKYLANIRQYKKFIRN